jgi:hypothetical protein
MAFSSRATYLGLGLTVLSPFSKRPQRTPVIHRASILNTMELPLQILASYLPRRSLGMHAPVLLGMWTMVAAAPFESHLDTLNAQTPIHTTALMAVNVAVPTLFPSSCSSVRLRIEDEQFNCHYSDIPLT